MDNDCSELEELNRLLSEGYLIAETTHQLAPLNPNSIDHYVTFFCITTSKNELLDQRNKNKTLLVLGHPKTGHRKELLVSDAATMQRTERQISYQLERIGTRIIARCVSVDNTPHDERQAYHGLVRLVASLNGLWEWDFALDEKMDQAFQVNIRLMSLETGEIEGAKNRLKELLDYLAVTRKVGFYVQDLALGPVRRCSLQPYFCGGGLEARLLDALRPEEIRKVDQLLSSDKNKIAARGLNQAYCENFVSSKLSILWAAAEGVFTTAPRNLLSKDEIEKLLAVAGCILTDTDENQHNSRLKKLADSLKDSERLSLIGRNERMAASMAQTIGLTEKEAYDKLKIASRLRGKHLHRLQKDWGELRKSVEFLEMALRNYLSQ